MRTEEGDSAGAEPCAEGLDAVLSVSLHIRQILCDCDDSGKHSDAACDESVHVTQHSIHQSSLSFFSILNLNPDRLAE